MNYFKRLWNCFCLNKTFFVSLFILIIAIISIVTLNGIEWRHQGKIYAINQINVIISVIITSSSIIFAYFWGNFNLRSKERIKKIKIYFKDIDSLKKRLLEVKEKLKEEFFYEYAYIIEFTEFFIKKFKKQELELFFMERWKMSNEVYKNLSAIIEDYELTLEKFKEFINKLKMMNWNDKQINSLIELLVKINIEQKSLDNILKTYNQANWEIIENLNQCLILFINYENETLKYNLENFIKSIKEKSKEFHNFSRECMNHKHFRNYSLCSIGIRKIEKNLL